MTKMLKTILLAAALLGSFSVIGTGLVALTFKGTVDKIEANEREALLRSLHALVPDARYDNDILSDVIALQDKAALGTAAPVSAYRARRQGKPVAVVLPVVAPNGYNGAIKLLVAINADATLAGVRVVTHKETPGLGDAIDESRSDWILGFESRSLANPGENQWAVKKDGGVFDQFTGATITPRAVVQAVHKALRYFRDNQAKLLAPPTPAKGQEATT